MVTVLSSAIHGAVGFGMNLLAVPVLLALDPDFVPGPVLVAGLLLSVLVGGREFGAFDRRLGWAFLGLFPGTGLGLVLLTAVPADALGVLLGVLVLVAVGLSALRWQPTPTAPALLTAGAASGFLGTAASIGGPPMALLYARAEGARMRSTLSVFFIAVALLSIASLAAIGRFSGHDLRLSAALVPGVVVGFLLSGPLRPLVDQRNAKPAVLALSAVAAVGAIVEALLS